MAATPTKTRVVVVGHGMVAHRFLTDLVQTPAFAAGQIAVTVVGEEVHPAYDRVALSSVFDGVAEHELHLAEPEFHSEHSIDVIPGAVVVEIDRDANTVITDRGTVLEYDTLVLATGSRPFVPSIEGSDTPGCFVYRTLDDLAEIKAMARRSDVRSGAVIGGGLLGLEAANALRMLGLDTHVVEFADRLMAAQLDDAGAAMLEDHMERLGLHVHTSMRTAGVAIDDSGELRGLNFDGAETLHCDMVVYSAGIRPRDELAGSADLELGERGGFAVNSAMYTSDPSILAIGECASVNGRCYGLVAPGYQMAAVAVAQIAATAGGLTRPSDSFHGADMSTKLKLLGVDVATVGSVSNGAVSHGDTPTEHQLVWSDASAGVYKRLDVDPETGEIRAAVLVGDASAYSSILGRYRKGLVEDDPSSLIAPAGQIQDDDPLICSCESVCGSDISSALDDGAESLADLKGCTRAGTGCGGCVPDLERILLTESGSEVTICGHLPITRPELYDLIRVKDLRNFTDVLNALNVSPTLGCEICKPAVASIFASVHNDYILSEQEAPLQDTNDRFLANMQRDGTYSVVPRIPGGEVTAEKLIVIGEVARDFDLYTKITGGQRIDLFGATVDQLPAIWKRLVDAGMESGHAYGKALRTVKSCVGETWCRYGVQDSTSMAILLEERYRGLRAPHKIKLAVSGCARECAEAQSKDVGVIATEKGWNLYVGGNGGKTPRHAQLLAEDLTDEALISYIDRFLMYYIRTAERLERTAPWLLRLGGGIDQLRRVVIEDVLGLAAEFEADVNRHVDTYECEWAATLDSPERLKRFVTFVNSPDEPDPTVLFVKERGQIRPARVGERP